MAISSEAVVAEARAICRTVWGLTDAEVERLLLVDGDAAAAVIRIRALLCQLYSPPLDGLWMSIGNKNAAIGGSESAPVRPVDHATASPGGLWDVVALLEGYAQGK
jgi:hypothetical protein